MKKHLLLLTTSLALATSVFAGNIGNLSEINPTAYGKYVPTFGVKYIGQNELGEKTYAMTFTNKYSLNRSADNDFYLKWNIDLGYLNKTKAGYAGIGVGLGDSFRVTENSFVAIDAGYQYNTTATGDKNKPLYMKQWHTYGAELTYGYNIGDFASIGIHGHYNFNKYTLKQSNTKLDSKTYGGGIPLSIAIGTRMNINIYGGYQTEDFDDSATKSKKQAVGAISFSRRFN
ncbi:hypothetical protein ACHJH3_06140 [Campylobacter sp. MOP7]|uniref:hypothetical protein n=1 Tax=Campylobacter canis TaxID=3378588 RepID=UPI00387E6874